MTKLLLLLLCLTSISLGACPPNCQTCYSNSNCTKCNSGYYWDSLYGSCFSCSYSCATCSSSSNCDSCISQYQLTGSSCYYCSSSCLTCGSYGKCSSCPTGYYLSGSSCYSCPSYCPSCTSYSTCSQNNTDTSSSSSGYWIYVVAVVATIFILVVSCICIRWFRHRGNGQVVHMLSADRIVPDERVYPVPGERVVPPKQKWKMFDRKMWRFLICQVNKQEETQVETICKHLFHVKCIASWHQKNRTCPTCRFDISWIKIICSSCKNMCLLMKIQQCQETTGNKCDLCIGQSHL